MLMTLICGVVGWGVKYGIGPRGTAGSGVEMGRRWLGWVVFLLALSVGTVVQEKGAVEGVAMWVAGTIFLGGPAFGVGAWVYWLGHRPQRNP